MTGLHKMTRCAHVNISKTDPPHHDPAHLLFCFNPSMKDKAHPKKTKNKKDRNPGEEQYMNKYAALRGLCDIIVGDISLEWRNKTLSSPTYLSVLAIVA